MKFSRLMTCVLGILVTGMMLSCSGSGQQNATGQNNSKTVAKLVGSELPVSTANDDQQNPHRLRRYQPIWRGVEPTPSQVGRESLI